MEFVKNLQSFLQSYNKSLINQACSGPYWENIGPRSFLYGPRCARSVLSRPRADILPVRPSRLVNKIYVRPSKMQLVRGVYSRTLTKNPSVIYFYFYLFIYLLFFVFYSGSLHSIGQSEVRDFFESRKMKCLYVNLGSNPCSRERNSQLKYRTSTM